MKQIILGFFLLTTLGFAQTSGLNLTDAQKEQIRQIMKEEREEYARLRKQSRERIASVLTPEQRQKWEARHEQRLEGRRQKRSFR